MAQLPNMTSYFSEQTMISILVPEGWEGQIVNEQQFRLFGPSEPRFNDYQPTMSYLRSQPEGYGMDWFEQLIKESGEELRGSYNELKLKGEERFVPSSLAPTYVRWYEWRDEDTNLRFSQLQALISSRDLYVINAATLTPLEDKYMPTFNAILKSTRIIPTRT